MLRLLLYRAFTHTQNALQSYEENRTQVHQGALTIIFFRDFCRYSIKTCKNWPVFFSSFSPYSPGGGGGGDSHMKGAVMLIGNFEVNP